MASRHVAEKQSSSWRQRAAAWLDFGRWRRRAPRRLRLCENLALGDRRFVSVIEFEEQKFLVGGTENSLAMLAVLSGRSAAQLPKADDGVPLWEFVDGDMVRRG